MMIVIQAGLIAMLSKQLVYKNAEVSCLVLDDVLRDHNDYCCHCCINVKSFLFIPWNTENENRINYDVSSENISKAMLSIYFTEILFFKCIYNDD